MSIAETFSFSCNACGKCCNSAPLMSVPELFHHETRFIGALGIQRKIFRPDNEISATDNDDIEKLSRQLLFNIDSLSGATFSLFTHALDYASLNRCPALGLDNLCEIHHDRKPVQCSLVPFDAHYPDHLQNLVLAGRKFDADCIVAGRDENYEVIISDRQLVNNGYQQSLSQRREDLRNEKHYWGEAVFAGLQHDLLQHRASLTQFPLDTVVSVSLAPVLMTIAGVSQRCLQRVLQYIDKQQQLIDMKVAEAIARKNEKDRPVTKELRHYKDMYQYLCMQLGKNFPSKLSMKFDILELENYLGL